MVKKRNYKLYNIDFFLNLEQQVWHALQQLNKDLDDKLLDDKFLGVYESGFANKQDHINNLLHGETILEYKLTEHRIINLTNNIILLTYKAQYKNTYEALNSVYISSVWQKYDKNIWKNIFSQDTHAK